MGDKNPSDVQSASNADEPTKPAPWLRATQADLKNLDFEAPIAGSLAADTNELSDLFGAATRPTDETDQPTDTPAIRVYTMLSAITGIHFKPEEHQEPFGPLASFADGRRTAIPADFRGVCDDVLADMAKRAKNTVLQARLADICWLLDRKRGDLGRIAVSAYVKIIQETGRGKLKFRFDKKDGDLQHDACQYLRRAIQIGRAIGWDKAETIAARETVIRLRKRAAKMRAMVSVLWFSELDLEFRVSDPAEAAASIDEVLTVMPDETNSHIIVELWRLAATAYHLAKRDDDKYRCESEAAERLVSDAEGVLAKHGSAFIAAHGLGTAIAQLHGVPNKRDRRVELRHKLIDVQAQIPEEMHSFSQELDLTEIVEKVECAVTRVNLTDKLFVLASVAGPPEPEQLTKEAVEAIQKHPLSSLFGTSHLDHEGKVVHRTDGSSLADSGSDSAIQAQVAQSESIRRQIVALGQIEPIRRLVAEHHFLSDDVFFSLFQHSPFVPHDLVRTFSRGFLRFFQGDFISATYILTPLLENSLRQVLKAHGHDVTTFDDATQTQRDRTLSSLYEQMRNELDEVFTRSVITDIDRVFLSKPGPHLRHSLSHGLFHDATPYGADAIYGCWLIFRLCLIPLYPYREELQLPFD